MTPRLKESLTMYVDYGYRCGGFLHAVLENNLRLAVGLADPENRRLLPDIVQYVWDHLPCDCFGSEEAVAGWLERKRRQREAAQALNDHLAAAGVEEMKTQTEVVS